MTDRYPAPVYLGTAGWQAPAESHPAFDCDLSHLERYGRVLPAAEINSSFHRFHKPATYRRWAASVPSAFRFSVKLPKRITHVEKLVDAQATLDDFFQGVLELGDRLGALLVQTPPKLEWDEEIVDRFLTDLRSRWPGNLAWEPRHVTWFQPHAEQLFASHRVARVAADPDEPAGASAPGGWPGLRYFRLHGSPRTYYSAYGPEQLDETAKRLLADTSVARWCIFDNTASGAGIRDAIALHARMNPQEQPSA